MLVLDGTQITDGGLECLRWTPRISMLTLGSTRITDEGLALARLSLPQQHQNRRHRARLLRGA
jgi:hypothetical protein